MVPRELPLCSICLERLREPVPLGCGHDARPRCLSAHRLPRCEQPCCPDCHATRKRDQGLRRLEEKTKLLLQRPPPSVLQVWGPGLI